MSEGPQEESGKKLKIANLGKGKFTPIKSNATPEGVERMTKKFEEDLEGKSERKPGSDYKDFSNEEIKAQAEEAERKYPGIKPGEGVNKYIERKREAIRSTDEFLRTTPGASSFAKGGSDSGEQDPGSTTTKQ